MKKIQEQSVVLRHREASHRVIEELALIVMPREATMLTLNRVGTQIWTRLGANTVEELASGLTDEYEVSRDQALTDTISFLEELRAKGLVVLAAGEES